MRVTDLLADQLVRMGITQVYMVTGGGAMHLNDSFAFHQGMHVTYNNHEQASAIAAEGYFRASGRIACVNVTTGPGGLNTLTGVMGQWTDSIPAVYISGQVKFETTISSCPDLKLRQLGDQEVDIVNVVRPIVKYAVQVRKPQDAGFELEKAIWLATHGRPGPVWLDIPLDVQGAATELSEQRPFVPESGRPGVDSELVKEVIAKIDLAKRPVLVAGHGVRLAAGVEQLRLFVERLGIPLLTTFNGMDLLEDDHPMHIGHIGTLGSRGGNFALQNADLALFIGTRNNIRQVSYNWSNFAHRAYKIGVDIDEQELHKPTVKLDLAIVADANDFIVAAIKEIPRPRQKRTYWLEWCLERKRKYPNVLPNYRERFDGIHPYVFVERLFELLPNKSVIVSANGTASIALFHAAKIREGQRVICNSGAASMGYDLPASIGAADGIEGDVACVAGDGSAQMNLQELGTISHHRYPIKIFYLNNDGYSSIRQTQDSFFGRRAGCDSASGVGLPNIGRIAVAFGIEYARTDRLSTMDHAISYVLASKGPALCEVLLTHDYIFSPKLASEKQPDGRIISKPLEDLFPFLSREELMSNMIAE